MGEEMAQGAYALSGPEDAHLSEEETMYLPRLKNIPRSEVLTDVFHGYVNRLKVGDGYFNNTAGLTLDEYPMLASRKPRGLIGQLTGPQGMIGKDALAYVDGGVLHYNGATIELPAGVSLSGSGQKQIVGMGAYICIFPDKVYVNTQDFTDAGYMEAYFSAVSGADLISCAPCRADGTVYEDVYIADSAPGNPEAGDYWLDTSTDVHSLKVYSETSGTWTTVPTVYTKISCANIGAQFAQYDGVTISGLTYAGMVDNIAEQAEALNGDKVIWSRDTDWIVIQGLIDGMFEVSGTLEVTRTVPSMDFVTESENRLWGCKYGMVGGKVVNELYACKLGDMKNWRCYMGLSTDSYAASLGSDGVFTGAITYQGHPTFFKEGVIHKVYGSQPSNFQIVTDEYRGVQKGSAESLAIVGTTLYYKSRVDVCAYDGSAPQGVSDALGDAKYVKAVGSAWNGKYVVSMQDEEDDWHTFVYDPERGWIRDGGQRMLHATSIGEEMYYIDGENRLWCSETGEGTSEGPVAWEAITGVMGWEYTRKKRVSRYNIRMRMDEGATAAAYLMYDSDGTWHKAAQLTGNGRLYTQHMFVIPRRCDHMQMKIAGVGKVEILSISRILEEASDL